MGTMKLRGLIDAFELASAETLPPRLLADRIGFLIVDLFSEHLISLYEGYLLHAEQIRFRRKSYLHFGSLEPVQISDLLSLLNQILLCRYFRDDSELTKYIAWADEAISANVEKRTHIILDRWSFFVESSREALVELSELREVYSQLPDDDGPYPMERFPFHFYSPEDLLLYGENINVSQKMNLCEELGDFIVDLALLE